MAFVYVSIIIANNNNLVIFKLFLAIYAKDVTCKQPK